MLTIERVSALALTLVATSAFAGPAQAGPVPSFTTFGSLPVANFGGSGIPNDAVAVTRVGAGIDSVTLGLTATPRFAEPAVTNNGAGVFHAVSGAYAAGDNQARWNYDFYVGGTGLAQYSYRLFADFDPAAGNSDSSYTDVTGYLGVPDSLLTLGTYQNSENLGFNTNFAQFDPNVAGQYGFILTASAGGTEVGRSAILVDVGTVPEPASLTLVSIALLGLARSTRRNRG